MLPFEDRVKVRRRLVPVFTILLVAANLAVFVYMLLMPQVGLESFVRTYGVVPVAFAQASHADSAPLYPYSAPLYPYLTLITTLFIHGGFVHLLGNMIFLWVFGDNAESALGHLSFLSLYFVSGIVGSLVQIVAIPTSQLPVVGASGAIAGVLAGYLLMFPSAQVRMLLFFGPFFAVGRAAALFVIFGWFALQVFHGVATLAPGLSETGGVAYLAHVGGFLTGGLITASLRRARSEPLGDFTGTFRVGWTFRNWLILVAFLGMLLAGSAIVGGVRGALFQGLILALAAMVALVDGLRRTAGRTSLLGAGRGVGRLMAIVQVLAALGVLGAILLQG